MTLFDIIARPYAWFFHHQVRQAERTVPVLMDALSESCSSVLDIGCGNGALCQVLQAHIQTVEGCDRSAAMLKQAKRLTSSTIKYTLGDTLTGLPYADKSFDMVSASLVAHGMPADQRKLLYAEMRRIARKYVILLEYNQTRHWLVDIMEFLEHGDYFNFIHVVDQELEACFGNLTKIPVQAFAAWYIMKVK
ncbi:MAG: class I SAM-dependent methyltransferase [Erysipelotrichaceae bacterium]